MPLEVVTSEDERGLQDVADMIAASHKVLVITGAGISTSIGIPVRSLEELRHNELTGGRISARRMDSTTWCPSKHSLPLHHQTLLLLRESAKPQYQTMTTNYLPPSTRFRQLQAGVHLQVLLLSCEVRTCSTLESFKMPNLQ